MDAGKRTSKFPRARDKNRNGAYLFKSANQEAGILFYSSLLGGRGGEWDLSEYKEKRERINSLHKNTTLRNRGDFKKQDPFPARKQGERRLRLDHHGKKGEVSSMLWEFRSSSAGGPKLSTYKGTESSAPLRFRGVKSRNR